MIELLFMVVLTNREIASAIWVVLFFGFFLFYKDIRKAFLNVFRILLNRYFLALMTMMVLYILLVIWGLYAVNVWTASVIKETIIWFFTSAVVLAFSAVSNRGAENLWRAAIIDNLKIIVLFQFLVGNYTFSLPVELIFVPLVTFLTMLNVVATSEVKYQQVAVLIGIVQLGILIYVVIWVVGSAIADYRNLGSIGTMRQIAIGPLLSIALTPFVYLLRLYADYETLFINLKIGPNKDTQVKKYARRKLITHLGLNSRSVRAFLQSDKRHRLKRIQTKADVDHLLEE